MGLKLVYVYLVFESIYNSTFIKVMLSLSVRPSFRDFLRIKDGMYVALHKIIIGIWKISQSVRSGR